VYRRKKADQKARIIGRILGFTVYFKPHLVRRQTPRISPWCRGFTP